MNSFEALTQRRIELENRIRELTEGLAETLPYKNLSVKGVHRDIYGYEYNSRTVSKLTKDIVHEIFSERKRINDTFKLEDAVYKHALLDKKRKQRELLKIRRSLEELVEEPGTPVYSIVGTPVWHFDDEVARPASEESSSRDQKRCKVELEDEVCEETEKACITCATNLAVVRAEDCGHRVLCIECMKKLKNSSSNWANKCPVCRCVMTEYSVIAYF